MSRPLWALLLAGLVIGLIISGRFAIHAQERAEVPTANSVSAVREKAGEAPKETMAPTCLLNARERRVR